LKRFGQQKEACRDPQTEEEPDNTPVEQQQRAASDVQAPRNYRPHASMIALISRTSTMRRNLCAA